MKFYLKYLAYCYEALFASQPPHLIRHLTAPHTSHLNTFGSYFQSQRSAADRGSEDCNYQFIFQILEASSSHNGHSWYAIELQLLLPPPAGS